MSAADVRLALVAAVAKNGVIGRDGQLPWRLPSDLRHFREITMGKPIIMGRRTHASIGRPLPGRDNIVVSSTLAPAAGVRVAPSLSAALGQGRLLARQRGVGEMLVIGGARLYMEALPLASCIYLTRVEAAVEGDVRFVPLPGAEWEESETGQPQQGPEDEYPLRFCLLRRR